MWGIFEEWDGDQWEWDESGMAAVTKHHQSQYCCHAACNVCSTLCRVGGI
jgi:hypothetical protein